MFDFPDRQTIRLKGYDYSQNGLYFLTICTHNRENMFGEIKNGEMVLNDVGKIVNNCWQEIPQKFPGVELDQYRIMPNHMHMIIKIVGAGFPRPIEKNIRPNDKKPPTLGQILAYFKYQSAKQIRISQTDKKTHTGAETAPLQRVYIKKIWQRNYFERIIRNEPEYNKICYYILHNPEMWERDRNNLKSRLLTSLF